MFEFSKLDEIKGDFCISDGEGFEDLNCMLTANVVLWTDESHQSESLFFCDGLLLELRAKGFDFLLCQSLHKTSFDLTLESE